MHPAATRPATEVDAHQTEPAYWLNQPASFAAESGEFESLWQAAEQTVRGRGWRLDRLDYRNGVMSAEPTTSQQFFEFWRRDVATGADLARSSLATVRRTTRFEFQRNPDGRYEVRPKVLVEQLASSGRRLTTAVQYQRAFELNPTGSRELDQGVALPPQYWYAVGRDQALEKELAEEIGKKLGKL